MQSARQTFENVLRGFAFLLFWWSLRHGIWSFGSLIWTRCINSRCIFIGSNCEGSTIYGITADAGPSANCDYYHGQSDCKFRQGFIWITELALSSWILRISFLGLIGSKGLPEWLKRHLRYKVVSMLPRIIVPLVFPPKATGGVFDLPHFWAAAIILLVGVWAGNLFAAIIVAT